MWCASSGDYVIRDRGAIQEAIDPGPVERHEAAPGPIPHCLRCHHSTTMVARAQGQRLRPVLPAAARPHRPQSRIGSAGHGRSGAGPPFADVWTLAYSACRATSARAICRSTSLGRFPLLASAAAPGGGSDFDLDHRSPCVLRAIRRRPPPTCAAGW